MPVYNYTFTIEDVRLEYRIQGIVMYYVKFEFSLVLKQFFGPERVLVLVLFSVDPLTFNEEV